MSLSLPIDQVLSKRRKVVKDMCNQLEIKARLEAKGEEWAPFRPAVDAFLTLVLI